MSIKLKTIDIKNFKAFSHFKVNLKDINMLVGSNNCGKTTVISTLRLLEYALKYGQRKNPSIMKVGNKKYAYHLDIDKLPILLENVTNNYNEEEATIEFIFDNNAKLTLVMPEKDVCYFTTDISGIEVSNTIGFKKYYPFNIIQIPVLGPLDGIEKKYKEDTIIRSIGTHRASRHFRNYWLLNKNNFEYFAEMLKETWPGMEIEKPEISYDDDEPRVLMFVKENRIARELYWSGYGFQIWCQLLTYISHSDDFSLLVVDEPDIYLHPEVQKQFLRLVRNLECQVVLATHSTEMIGDADPNEIILIDKTKRQSKRLIDIDGLQDIMNELGSLQNITLTNLAKTRKLVFTEGEKDLKVIKSFANHIGNKIVSKELNITFEKSEGFSSWENIRAFAWGFKKWFGEELVIGAIFDKDYFCEEEIEDIKEKLNGNISLTFIHRVKEIENYLLNIYALERATIKAIDLKNKKLNKPIIYENDVEELLMKICDDMKSHTISQLLAKSQMYNRQIPKGNVESFIEDFYKKFENAWNDKLMRLRMVPGKEALSSLRKKLTEKYNICLSDNQIINSFIPSEVDKDMVKLISLLETINKG